MTNWIGIFLQRMLASLWFVPGLMTFAAAALALFCGYLDEHVIESEAANFIYHGELDGIRTLLSTVAGSMITVAGVAFSVTMVALSLASSQLGPRLLVNFMRDTGNQVVLGSFIATFLFCVMALGSTPLRDGEIISVSVTVALALTVVSLGMLIFFIHHIASSMQADEVIRMVSRDLDKSLSEMFVDEGDDRERATIDEVELNEPFAEVRARNKGYLQGIDLGELVHTARKHNMRLRMRRRPGHYITSGSVLLQAHGATELREEIATRLQEAFLIGGSRTAEQDVEFGIHQLVEIALRALSPGINDAFTAITCVDHLCGILTEVAPLRERSPIHRDDAGEIRVVTEPSDFIGALDAAFNQIRQNAISVPSVSIRLLEALTTIARATRDPTRLAAIDRHGRMVRDGSREHMLEDDRAALEERYRELREQLER